MGQPDAITQELADQKPDHQQDGVVRTLLELLPAPTVALAESEVLSSTIGKHGCLPLANLRTPELQASGSFLTLNFKTGVIFW